MTRGRYTKPSIAKDNCFPELDGCPTFVGTGEFVIGVLVPRGRSKGKAKRREKLAAQEIAEELNFANMSLRKFQHVDVRNEVPRIGTPVMQKPKEKTK
jgi:hypothetical protein